MTLANDTTVRLWKTLMPRRREISNRLTNDYISMQVYSKPGLRITEKFSPETRFDKWAAVEVADFSEVPDGMQTYLLGGGRYAVFLHRGPASQFLATLRFIYGEWLPASGYAVDDREHFEVLQEGWNPLDEQGQEHVFVPIRDAEEKA